MTLFPRHQQKGTILAGPSDTYIVQLVVQPAGIADRVSIGISSPESGRGGLTVCTGCTCPSCCRLGVGRGGKIKTCVQNYGDRLKKQKEKKTRKYH